MNKIEHLSSRQGVDEKSVAIRAAQLKFLQDKALEGARVLLPDTAPYPWDGQILSAREVLVMVLEHQFYWAAFQHRWVGESSHIPGTQKLTNEERKKFSAAEAWRKALPAFIYLPRHDET